jgi:hypothetical protein
MDCYICGERKPKPEFKNIMYFSTYKKRKVQWCKECQKMYVKMKREKENEEEQQKVKINYLVSFQ